MLKLERLGSFLLEVIFPIFFPWVSRSGFCGIPTVTIHYSGFCVNNFGCSVGISLVETQE